MKKGNKKYIVILLCVIIALGLFLVLRHKSQVYSNQNNSNERKSSAIDNIANNIAFECSDGKSLTATFYVDGTADINLADKKTVFITKEKLTESDSRFYSKDKSLVFWTEGDEQMSTFIQKDGVITERCKFLTNIE